MARDFAGSISESRGVHVPSDDGAISKSPTPSSGLPSPARDPIGVPSGMSWEDPKSERAVNVDPFERLY